MLASVYTAACLVALSAATPLAHESRSLGGYSSQSSSSAQSQQSSSSSMGYPGGFAGAGGLGLMGGMGGLGGMGGMGAFGAPGFGSSVNQFSQQSSSYSYQSVANSFSSVASMIGQIQSMMAAGSMSQAIAYQQMSQLAMQFQAALNQAPLCVSCFSGGQFPQLAYSVFNQFSQMMTQMQSTFGSSFGSIASPFAQMSNSFNSFFQSASSSGMINQIIPNGFIGAVSPIFPGIGSQLTGLGFKKK